MNLTELKTALKRYGFNDDDPLTTWINAALHELELAYDWPFFEQRISVAINTGVDAIVLPSDFLRIKYAKIVGQSEPLSYLSIDDYNVFVAGNESDTGVPGYYTLVGMNTMEVWPIPDNNFTLTLHYRGTITELSVGNDVPAIPEALHFPVVQKAASIGLSAENEEDRAATEATFYNNAVAQAMIVYGKKSGEARTVQDKQGYGL